MVVLSDLRAHFAVKMVAVLLTLPSCCCLFTEEARSASANSPRTLLVPSSGILNKNFYVTVLTTASILRFDQYDF